MSKTITNEELEELKNLNNVKYIVERSENPHPLTIVLIIVGVILILYFCYMTFVKKNLTGEWVDDDDNVHVIKHNTLQDTIMIFSGDDVQQGVVNGDVVIVYVDETMRMGIYTDNNIEWMDSSSWQCVYGY